MCIKDKAQMGIIKRLKNEKAGYWGREYLVGGMLKKQDKLSNLIYI